MPVPNVVPTGSPGGTFKIDLNAAQQVLNALRQLQNDVNQYTPGFFQAVNALEYDWQGFGVKASWFDGYVKYRSAIQRIQNTLPDLIAGLTKEIALVQQAEGVPF